MGKVAIVFDTWALLALIFGEKEADAVEALLRLIEKEKIIAFYSVVNAAELYRRICVEDSEEAAKERCVWLKNTKLRFKDATFEEAMNAGHIKNKYSKLSYGDAFAVALAMDVRADFLASGDPEFESVEETKVVRPSELCEMLEK